MKEDIQEAITGMIYLAGLYNGISPEMEQDLRDIEKNPDLYIIKEVI